MCNYVTYVFFLKYFLTWLTRSLLFVPFFPSSSSPTRQRSSGCTIIVQGQYWTLGAKTSKDTKGTKKKMHLWYLNLITLIEKIHLNDYLVCILTWSFICFLMWTLCLCLSEFYLHLMRWHMENSTLQYSGDGTEAIAWVFFPLLLLLLCRPFFLCVAALVGSTRELSAK